MLCLRSLVRYSHEKKKRTLLLFKDNRGSFDSHAKSTYNARTGYVV